MSINTIDDIEQSKYPACYGKTWMKPPEACCLQCGLFPECKERMNKFDPSKMKYVNVKKLLRIE